MIIKSYEIRKINFDLNKIILLHGNNDAIKSEIILKIKNHKNYYNLVNYEENEILKNYDNFLSELLNQSLFEKEKIIIVNRISEKILDLIKAVNIKNIENTIIILNSIILEKKSKLRNFFEKDEFLISIAVYPDNDETLSKLASNFFKSAKISISQSNVNLIINKCNGDRQHLINELEKISTFSQGKTITENEILKLTNLIENYNISELIDSCLDKNFKKIINIINMNKFNHEDCLIMIKTFLNKLKKILNLIKIYKKTNNLETTIQLAQPPIFWKNKEIVKRQITKWSEKEALNLLFYLNNLDFLVKKNYDSSINLTLDFILNRKFLNTNN